MKEVKLNQKRKSQCHFLKYLESSKEVLILGGGTGWIAKEILSRFPQLSITYIEASAQMIVQAKQKISNYSNRISFIHGTEKSIPTYVQFDTVIANFYFDLFTDVDLSRALNFIRKSMTKDSLWLISDFKDDGKWWQKILLKSMFAFFRITCGIRLTKLVDWRTPLLNSGFEPLDSKAFYKGFILSSVYRLMDN